MSLITQLLLAARKLLNEKLLWNGLQQNNKLAESHFPSPLPSPHSPFSLPSPHSPVSLPSPQSPFSLVLFPRQISSLIQDSAFISLSPHLLFSLTIAVASGHSLSSYMSAQFLILIRA